MTSWASPKVVEFKNRESLVSPLRVKAPVVASRVKLPAVPSEYPSVLQKDKVGLVVIVGLRLGVTEGKEEVDGDKDGL